MPADLTPDLRAEALALCEELNRRPRGHQMPQYETAHVMARALAARLAVPPATPQPRPEPDFVCENTLRAGRAVVDALLAYARGVEILEPLPAAGSVRALVEKLEEALRHRDDNYRAWQTVEAMLTHREEEMTQLKASLAVPPAASEACPHGCQTQEEHHARTAASAPSEDDWPLEVVAREPKPGMRRGPTRVRVKPAVSTGYGYCATCGQLKVCPRCDNPPTRHDIEDGRTDEERAGWVRGLLEIAQMLKANQDAHQPLD